MNNNKNIEVIYKSIETLIPYVNNTRTHSEKQVNQICASIKEFGFTNPILIDGENGIIAGHGRVLAASKLKLESIPTIELSGLSKTQKKAYIIADNKLALNAGWDDVLLKLELQDLKEMGFDTTLTGFELDELDFSPEVIGLTDEEEVPEVPVNIVSVLGDVWLLGNHRLMCGDSTSIDAVDKLMNGKKADMVFTDPPYGMKKASDGVLNDNLNFNDLLEFNKQWIPLTISATKENGSWYCWGIDEPLMDIYSEIIKPYIDKQQASFRNLITWDKGNGQGQNSENTRSFAIADEKCLFIMFGIQGFNNNADNYFNGWDCVVNYLNEQKEKANLNIKDCKRLAGHSEKSGCHWFDKSQWSFPTEEVYNSWRNYCKTNNLDSFNKEYKELKKEYNRVKEEYNNTRAYFNNIHDNFNNVWHFKRHVKDGTEGNHATPKPLPLCERGILSSSREGEIVLDVFGGSGSTLIACETTKRIAYMMEFQENYTDVIIKRWQEFTGKTATLESNGKTFKELYDDKYTN